MAIKDIKFMNGEGYLLKDLPLSLDEYVAQMQLVSYDSFYDSYRKHRDDSGVEKTQFPPIVFSFYSVIFLSNRLPSPEALLQEYYKQNESVLHIDSDIVTYQGKTFQKVDLDARILRTYPSLVRDFHFYLMLVQENCFDKVIYSCKSDVAGIDLIVQHRGKKFTLSLFVNTNRGTLFKRIKNAFRHVYSSPEIPLPLDLQTAAKCGDFFVYGPADIAHVKAVIFGSKRKTIFRK